MLTRWPILLFPTDLTSFFDLIRQHGDAAYSFMFAYAAYALRRFLGFSWAAVALGLAAFAALMLAGFAAPCPLSMRSLVRGDRCLNGSVGYLPALLMLAAVGLHALSQRHPATPALIAASFIFSVSLAARTLDLELCGASRFLGQLRGTHAVWHTLNAITLGLLLIAAVRQGIRNPSPPPSPPP